MTRIWDAFLTDQDRQHVDEYPGRPEHGLGVRPVLLMLDNYRAAFGDEPLPLMESVKTWPLSTGLSAWEAIEPISRVLGAARSAAVPVVHVTALHEKDSGMGGWYQAAQRGGAFTSEDERSRWERKYDLIEELAPIEGEVVFRKAAPSAFTQTPLLAHLHELKADTVIVCGESTSGCVRATVVDGAGQYRYTMILPEDCVFDRHEAAHAINLFDMWRKYADVVPSQQVIDSLDGVRSAAS